MNYAALWSHSQKSFHVQTVHEMIDDNIVAFAKNMPSDYIVMFIGTEQECRTIISKLEGKLRNRA